MSAAVAEHSLAVVVPSSVTADLAASTREVELATV